jgi:hypothetical protein
VPPESRQRTARLAVECCASPSHTRVAVVESFPPALALPREVLGVHFRPVRQKPEVSQRRRPSALSLEGTGRAQLPLVAVARMHVTLGLIEGLGAVDSVLGVTLTGVVGRRINSRVFSGIHGVRFGSWFGHK